MVMVLFSLALEAMAAGHRGGDGHDRDDGGDTMLLMLQVLQLTMAMMDDVCR
jgi:hypothetical protein